MKKTREEMENYILKECKKHDTCGSCPVHRDDCVVDDVGRVFDEKLVVRDTAEHDQILKHYEYLTKEPTPAQEAKDTNGKMDYTLVPPAIITAIGHIREYGNQKYHDPNNWKQVPADEYWKAYLRHTIAAWNNYKAKDKESGMYHIWHAACNLAFLCQMMTWEDTDG